MLKTTSLAARLTLLLTAASALAVAAQIAIGYHAVRQALYEDAFATYRATTRDLSVPIQRSLNDNLPWSMQEYLQNLIERQRLRHEGVLRIVIADNEGRVVLDTNPLHIGQPLQAEWLPTAADGDNWVRAAGADVISGRLLGLNPTGAKGALLVLQNREDIESRLTGILLRLVAAGALVLFAAGLAAGVMSYIVTRPLRQWSGMVLACIDAASAAEQLPTGATGDPAATIAAAELRLRHAEHELLRIGTGSEAHA